MQDKIDSLTGPSNRYHELVSMCRDLHEQGDLKSNKPASKTFTGYSLYEQLEPIQKLIRLTESKRVLDYGCGKGKQYDQPVVEVQGSERKIPVVDYWGVDVVHCYDPAYTPFSKRPTCTFDGVICTDVMEHCAEEDILWMLTDIFNYAERFVFASIAAYPANKTLPNGENAHVTIKPYQWWNQLWKIASAAKPNVLWEIRVEQRPNGDSGIQTRLGNFLWMDSIQRLPSKSS